MSGLANDRCLLSALVRHARQNPDRVAIGDGTQSLTWSQLASRVEAVGQRMGSQASQRLIRIVHNTIDDVCFSLACMAASRLEVTIDGRFSDAAQRELIERSGGVLLSNLEPLRDVQSSDFAVLDRIAQSIDLDAPSIVLWTSGTTATPRGVVLSHRNLVCNAAAKLLAVAQSIDDHRLTVLSIAHAYARTCDMGTWLLSGCRWTIGLGGRSIDRSVSTPVTVVNVVPSLANRLLHRRLSGDPNWASLRLVGIGGAAVDVTTFASLTDLGIEVIQGYGCTEASPVICSATPGKTVAGCVGALVDGWQSRVIDGRLQVRGPGVMLGYLDDPNATSTVIDEDGWLDTGDLVRCHDNGQWQILGRADDAIVLSNGFKIHPQSIEVAAQSIAPVQRAVLIRDSSDELILAIESESLDAATVRATVQPLLPPGTPWRLVAIDPPLSESTGELTAKGTVRRDRVAERWIKHRENY